MFLKIHVSVSCICIIIKKALWGGGYGRQIVPVGLN